MVTQVIATRLECRLVRIDGRPRMTIDESMAAIAAPSVVTESAIHLYSIRRRGAGSVPAVTGASSDLRVRRTTVPLRADHRNLGANEVEHRLSVLRRERLVVGPLLGAAVPVQNRLQGFKEERIVL